MATLNRSELIMIYGVPGTGKTVGALSIVQKKPNHSFYYLEGDRILDPALEMFNEDANWDNLFRFPAFTYEQFSKSSTEIIGIISSVPDPENHWVILDTIGHDYREIQNSWSLRVHKMSAEALRASRLNGNNTDWKQGYSFDGFSGKEWPFIKNAFYNEFLWPMIRFHRNNAILIAHSRPTGTRFSPQAPTEFTELFSQLGQLPDVHKDVINYVHTCLYFSNVDGFQFRTLKESGRRKWIGLDKPVEFADFWNAYQEIVMNP